MSINQHVENRAWAFRELDELQQFLADPDFEGEVEEERAQIDRKRKELKEGKYRVVFLGAFNVGKSTLINAFLGDTYLPTVLEECTTKITHVTRADSTRTVLNLIVEPTEEELGTLQQLIQAYGIRASVDLTGEREITISYLDPSPKAVVTSLRALTTMSAEEDYPQLRSLRLKYEELFVYVENKFLEDDIALVDSPGVHSISETNRKVAHDIIPDSHLVVCMLDSQNAGNEQSRDFIERIIKQRHRKVFFVINKADQLNADEIDPQGRRGPAKDLFRSLEGIVEAPELFFVSSLYALVAVQLAQGKMTLAELEGNNKIKVPFKLHRELVESGQAEQGAAGFLMDASMFSTFRMRLLDYLYTENREGAIVESVCRFLDNKAWKYARPLEVKLDLVRNIPRLQDIKQERATLDRELQTHKHQAETIQEDFESMSGGGKAEGREYPGYAKSVDARFNQETLEREVLAPLRVWVEQKDRFRDARRNNYKPVLTDMQQRVDQYLSRAEADVNKEADRVERRTIEQMGPIADNPDRIRTPHSTAPRHGFQKIRISATAYVVSLVLIGALVFGALGAFSGAAFMNTPDAEIRLAEWVERFEAANVDVGTIPQTPEDGATLGGTGGAIVGAFVFLLIAVLTSNSSRRKKLRRTMEAQVNAAVLGPAPSNAGGQQAPARDALKQGMALRKQHFRQSVDRALDKDMAHLTGRIDALHEEEQGLRAQQQADLARLEPKVAWLQALGRDASDIAETGAPKAPGTVPNPIAEGPPESIVEEPPATGQDAEAPQQIKA